ncbi:MAG: hypothetical protein U9P44_03780 [archaeon]|nr:hypothetical protein [archaeon]
MLKSGRFCGNLDNMWSKPKKLETCLTARMDFFGSLRDYTDFLKDMIDFCGNSVKTAVDFGCGVAIPTISLVDEGLIGYVDLLDKFWSNLRRNNSIIEDNYPHLEDKINFIQQDLYGDILQYDYDLVLALTVARRSELSTENLKVRNICNAVKPGGYLIMSIPLRTNGDVFTGYTKNIVFDSVVAVFDYYDIEWFKSCRNDIEMWCLGQKAY